ncbi:MAG TPA: class I SAM-dependent methyltransferase [Solirubrobacteraceae bacterium]|nr:class I SAM-dependent methyltransferase [Solirubrobacteraceae bacterium]
MPRLDGLSSRLDGLGAAFLDIGVGVAKLSIAIAGTWPSPRVLGIDPFLPALTLGADHVAQAGLHDRVALRALRAEELDADQAFDLAWFSLPFVPDTVLERALSKVHAALRPGGWLLTATLAGPGELGMALARLRTSRFGGRVIASPEVETLLMSHGFVDVVTFPPTTWGPGILTAARRPIG